MRCSSLCSLASAALLIATPALAAKLPGERPTPRSERPAEKGRPARTKAPNDLLRIRGARVKHFPGGEADSRHSQQPGKREPTSDLASENEVANQVAEGRPADSHYAKQTEADLPHDQFLAYLSDKHKELLREETTWLDQASVGKMPWERKAASANFSTYSAERKRIERVLVSLHPEAHRSATKYTQAAHRLAEEVIALTLERNKLAVEIGNLENAETGPAQGPASLQQREAKIRGIKRDLKAKTFVLDAKQTDLKAARAREDEALREASPPADEGSPRYHFPVGPRGPKTVHLVSLAVLPHALPPATYGLSHAALSASTRVATFHAGGA